MTDMTDDLVAFLKARLDEDEAGGDADAYPPPGYADADRQARGFRTLAEVEAKREIVAQHVPVGKGDVCLSYCHTRAPGAAQAWPCLTLRLVAMPYADHPDFREGWRPAQVYRVGVPSAVEYRPEGRP